MSFTSSKNPRAMAFKFCIFLFFFLSVVLLSNPLMAAPEKTKATLVEYLDQEKSHLTEMLQEIRQNALPKDEKEFNAQMKHASTVLQMNSAGIQSLEHFFENQKKQQVSLNQKLKYLQQLPLGGTQTAIQQRVAKVEESLKQNKKTIELIVQDLQLAKEYELSLKDNIKKLQVWKEDYALKQQLILIKKEKHKLKEELSGFYQQNIKKQKHSKDELNSQVINEAHLLINNQSISLIHQKINALNAKKMAIQADVLLTKYFDTKTLQIVIDKYRDSIDQTLSIEKSLQQMLASLNNQSYLFSDAHLKKPAKALQERLKRQQAQASAQKIALFKKLEGYQVQLKRLVSLRQSLSEYNLQTLPVILNKLAEIPALFYKYLKTLTLKIYDSYTWLEKLPTVLLWFFTSLIILLFASLNYLLKNLRSNKERSRLTGFLYDGALTIVQRNIPLLCFISIVWFVLYVTRISFANYQLLFNILAIWFTFRVLILIARLVLLERISDSSGKDVKLYYRLKWLLLFGGWTTALMVFSHLFPLPLLLQDIFNRLFMLFILFVSLVAWKSKDVIPYLLRPFLKHKKKYFRHAVSLMVILVPITLFTTAVIGLSGFINLAWTMSRYQAYLLLVLVGYVLSRGLLFDALELISEWMISALDNGWLWIEVFLKPFDKILRIVLLVGSALILFQLYGWHSGSPVMLGLGHFAKYPIVQITGIHITIASTMEFIILLALFIWAAKWTREFCYRWLYKNAKDPGIRNSLSVFTQYAVILLGSFIALHVLGLDFSGMSMIIGGLAVGMGFGLRDFASNIIGGLMLLIERPVREGDLITLGEYEGKVAHIGIRSMRVSSWDNMEVLIPNAETFNKPFTNWTHQDSIVRTVVPIKVSRMDDPVMVQQLILDVLAIIPEIVPEPPAQVFLKSIDAALIEFEVRYFINVQLYTRFEVRSKVLFAITAQFKAAGIQPPVEPISIEIKERNKEFHIEKESSGI